MKTDSKLFRGILSGFFAVSGILLILQTIAYLAFYGIDGSNYFERGTVIPAIVTLLALVAFFAAAVFSFVWKPSEKERNQCHERFRPFLIGIAVFPAAAILFCMDEHPAGWIPALLHMEEPIWILPLLLFLSGISFVLASHSEAEKNLSYVSFFLCFSIFSLLWAECRFYFESTLEMNAPLKVAALFGMLTSMLYFVYEIRAFLGMPLPKMHLLTALWTLLSGSFCSIPVIVAFLNGVHGRYDILAGAVISLGASIMALLRLLKFCFAEDDASAEKLQ